MLTFVVSRVRGILLLQFQTPRADVTCFQAECAAKISLKQLRIALEMGSAPVVIRCHLYFALSLLQTSRLHAAKHLILLVYLCVYSILCFMCNYLVV